MANGETWCSGGTLGVDCAASPAATNMPNWDPAQNSLWLVFGDKCVSGCANDLNFADGAFQGGIYGVHQCHLHGGCFLFAGPLICGQIDVDGSGTAAFTFPPMTFEEAVELVLDQPRPRPAARLSAPPEGRSSSSSR